MIRFLVFITFIGLFACTATPDLKWVESSDDSGRLIKYQIRKKDGVKQGLFQKYYGNGNRSMEATYEADSLHGPCKYYYESGQLESVVHYKNGQYDGLFEKYFESGKLQITQTFVNGALDGPSIAYFENGNIREQVILKNNDENGPFQEYYENGRVAAEGAYAPTGDEEGGSAEHGELREYDTTGQLIRIADCNMGICHTRWKKE